MAADMQAPRRTTGPRLWGWQVSCSPCWCRPRPAPQAERDYGTAHVLGVQDALDLGAASFDDVTVATDEALVAASDEGPAETEDSLGDVDGTLADLRGAMPPPSASRTRDELQSAERRWPPATPH